MERKPIFKRSFGPCAFMLAVGVLGVMATGEAAAGCGQFFPMDVPHSDGLAPQPMRSGLMPAVFRPGSQAFIRLVDDRGEHESSLVGMWNVTFTSDGTAYPQPIPAGATLDVATIQYHSDGTEFQISGTRPPSTGDVCMGVWKQTGERTYKLRHVALAWVSSDSTPPVSPAQFLGPGIFHEEINLDRSGNTFQGTVTIDQYAKDGVTLLEHIGGTMKGTRFTVD
jgi:hypothetical protein